MSTTTDGAERLWTYADLAARWGISPRRAREMARALKIRPVVLGYKTIRFRPCSVVKAEEMAENGPRRTGWLG